MLHLRKWGGDNITTLYKYYETSDDANNDNTYMNSGSMSVIPPELFFHRNFDIDRSQIYVKRRVGCRI